jgi:hypothetical protein
MTGMFHHKFFVSIFLLLGLLIATHDAEAQQTKASQFGQNIRVPYSTDSTHLCVWNGNTYTPVFLKGVNLGVAVPGTFPGELAASRAQYGRWLEKLNNIGFNVVRTYTLNFPRFYEVLDSFNRQNPKHPVYLLQGIWLEEELEGYHKDLYFLSDFMDQQINETIDCIHGNNVIAPRKGKAYGTYTTDVSPWLLGYIVGREVHPDEVLTTNTAHPNDTIFSGEAFSMPHGSPTETWVTQRLNQTVVHERENYQTERPVSFSSWPTLDPIRHPSETGDSHEDTASLDLENMDISKAPAGFFISYHAYPYYPDFINKDSLYLTYSDWHGPNSYLGYLTDLKKHYARFPLIIAETGTPSSWGIAHYSNSGMNHGGLDEIQEGYNFIRILDNLTQAGCGGGIAFEMIDEWFKRTWITDNMDFNPDRRILWHNITAAEQNFGLIKFVKKPTPMQLLDDFGTGEQIQKIYANTDYDFLHLKLQLKTPLNTLDTLWIALDTYADSLGESILPSGDTVKNRAEFALRITNYSAELFVTRAYDLYGIWFYNVASDDQLFHSIATDGGPWDIVHWKNSTVHPKIQYIGNLVVKRAEIFPSSRDAVVISDTSINIRLPWTLINFTDPSNMRVMHDFKNIAGTQDTISDGIAISILHNHSMQNTSQRYVWESWNQVKNIEEQDKACVPILKENLYLFNNPAIPRPDHFQVQKGSPLNVSADSGLLCNDIDFDGNEMSAFVDRYPKHGDLFVYDDGSFHYYPDQDFEGVDHFSYFVYDGMDLSDTASVNIEIGLTGIETKQNSAFQLYPNPASGSIHLHFPGNPQRVPFSIHDMKGSVVLRSTFKTPHDKMDVSTLLPGIYIFRYQINNRIHQHKLIIK